MKKTLLTTAGALLGAGLLLFAATAPADTDTGTAAPTENYPVNFDKTTALNPSDSRFTSRYTDFVSLSSPEWGASRVTTSQTAAQTGTIYNDCTSQAVHAAPGEAVTVTVGYHGGWMMGLVFVDFDNNGQYDWSKPEGTDSQVAVAALNGDMKSFSLYSVSYDNADHFFTTTGESASMVNNYAGSMTLPAFTIPADAAAGDYNMRVVVGWSDCGPGGNDAVIANGGAVIDMKLTVGTNPDNDNTYYSVNAGKDASMTRTDRYTSSVSFSGKHCSKTIAVNQNESHKLYHYLKDQYIVAEAGETVNAAIGFSRDWMNTYFYLDTDNDGRFDWDAEAENKGNGDLLSFSNIGGTNSAGGAGGNNKVLPAFTIPSDMAPGMYRARFKVDWDCGDAGGSTVAGNTIIANGGCIVDVPMIIVGENNTPAVTLEGTPAGGTVEAGEGANLTLTPETGYTVGTLTAKAVFTNHGHGNPTEMDFTFGGPTIPVGALAGESVTVDVTNAFAPIPDYDGYTLVWNDEFNTPDGTHPDMDKNYVTSTRYNAAWNRFISSREDLMVMDGGSLAMYCKPNPEADRTETDDREMVSGAIQTSGKILTKYGRIEARMKVYGYSGSFPAFWMMPKTQPNGWPTSGEIDIFESINNANTAYATLHAGTTANQDLNTAIYSAGCTINDWHVYSVEWEEDVIRAYIDGVKKGEVTKASIRNGVWPFNDQQFYIILNQSVGNGSWAANPDVNHTYRTDVDWVRIYQKNDLLAPVVTFVDADGNALAEQPTTIALGETLTVKVETSSTAAISVNAEGLTVAPVEGSTDMYTITPDGSARQMTVSFNALYPSGAEASDAVTLTGSFAILPSPLKLSTETESHWYTFSNVGQPTKCAVIAADNESYPIQFIEKADADANSYWKITRHTDGGFNLVSFDGTKYISGDALAANDSPIGISDNEPVKSFEIVAAYQSGEFIIRHRNHDSASSAYFNYGNGKAESGNIPYLNSWHNHGSDMIDGVCQFGVKQRKPGVTFTFEEAPASQITKGEGEHYTVKVLPSGSEEWLDIPATVGFAQEAKIRVEPEEGYRLTAVTVDGAEQTMPADAEAFEANFVVTGDIAVSATAEMKTYTVSWTQAEGEETHYDVTVKKRDTDEVLTLPATVEHNTVLNIVITPHEGYRLTGAKIGDEVKTSENLEEDGTFVAVPTIQADMDIRDVTAEMTEPTITPSAPEEEKEGVTFSNLADVDDPATEDIDETKVATLLIELDGEDDPATVELPAEVRNSDNPDDDFEFSYEGDIRVASAAFDFEEPEEGVRKHKIVVRHNNMTGSVLVKLHRKAAATARTMAEGDEAAPASEPVWQLLVTVTGGTRHTATGVTLTGVPTQLYLNQSFTVGASVEPASSTDAVNIVITASPEDAVVVKDNGDGTYTVTAVKTGTVRVTATAATWADALDAAPYDFSSVTLRNATGNPGEGVTGIDAVNADAAEGRAEIYDLAGRRLTRVDAAGIYIVNGRKTVVR